MTRRRWRVRLSKPAVADVADILRHTRNVFGPLQGAIYKETIKAALSALDFGPEVGGSAVREDIGKNLRVLHVARNGRRGRHFIVYKASQKDVIEVVRILYDGMDLARHLQPDFEKT